MHLKRERERERKEKDKREEEDRGTKKLGSIACKGKI